MAAAPLLLPLAIGGAAIGGATSAIGAAQQNRAIQRSQRSAVRGATTQMDQLAQAAALERQKRINEARAIEGRLRVTAADAGVGIGGTFEALIRQNDRDTAANVQVIERNFAAGTERIRSGLEADLLSLSAGFRNPILDSFAGAFRGAQTGLAISSAAGSVSDAIQTARAPGQLAAAANAFQVPL